MFSKQAVLGINFAHYVFPGPKFSYSENAKQTEMVYPESIIMLVADITTLYSNQNLRKFFNYIEGVFMPYGAAGDPLPASAQLITMKNEQNKGNG
jgi:hypothetical protein